jgi:5-methylcytosine-specific restriction endonuclease McrA
MSKTCIPVGIQRQVIERAKNRCEYCRLHEDDASLRHEVDHIIAEKHGGATTLENLVSFSFSKQVVRLKC